MGEAVAFTSVFAENLAQHMPRIRRATILLPLSGCGSMGDDDGGTAADDKPILAAGHMPGLWHHAHRVRTLRFTCCFVQ